MCRRKAALWVCPEVYLKASRSGPRAAQSDMQPRARGFCSTDLEMGQINVNLGGMETIEQVESLRVVLQSYANCANVHGYTC
uniref:Uncharacterized protein n=1 Tax=Knipowitschia caucasica TaxID=637954 RepID=A0AAV2IQD1_KNICA